MKLSNSQQSLMRIALRDTPFHFVNTRNLRAAFALCEKGLLQHVGAGRHPADAQFHATPQGLTVAGELFRAAASLSTEGEIK